MDKRNVVILTALLATVIAGSFFFWPGLGDFRPLRGLYVPAILMTIVFSGGIHEISAVAGWSSFVVCTLIYWGILLVGYAVLWEIHLVNQGAREIDGLELAGAPGGGVARSATPDSLTGVVGY